MNFQNDETNGHVHVIHQINHTKMIVVIPKSTQRIDFTMTFIMMNGYTPGWAQLKQLLLNPCLPGPAHLLAGSGSPSCSLSSGTKNLPPGARPTPGPTRCVPLRGPTWGTGGLRLTKLLSDMEKSLAGCTCVSDTWCFHGCHFTFTIT